jgi:hypothetical protein
MARITATTTDDDPISIEAKTITHVIRDGGRGGAIVYFLGGAQIAIAMPYADFVAAWQAAED